MSRKGQQRARRHDAVVGFFVGPPLVFLLMLFPTVVFGVQSEALSFSTGATSVAQCREESGDWICPVWEDEVSGTVDYRIEMDSIGCWEGTRAEGNKARFPPASISGCVTGFDYLGSLLL